MKLPRNKSELERMFREAAAPNMADLRGEYFVDMLTRTPSIRILSHRKAFFSRDDRIEGRNVLFSNLCWGSFFLEDGSYEGSRTVVINYNTPDNFPFTRRIRDHLKCIEEGRLYLGRFNVLFRGRLMFLGFFTLTMK